MRIATVEDEPALVVFQTLNGKSYETWIFSDGCVIREATVSAGTAVIKTDGQKIIESSKLTFERVGDMLKVTVSDENGGNFDAVINIMQFK